MANPQPGDPKLVAQIVNRLKSQGLFDQFRRDCLADVDTKPAYQNLRQRVDSFVSNHLAGHTWSPHLNKNQLRNNIRQQVLNSGMLESGIDRIISQVVDPKINQMFRPQVEKAVHEFLNTVNIRDEASVSTTQIEEKPDITGSSQQGLTTAGPSANVANDAMSILETISSLNQEACAARSSTENPCSKVSDRASRKLYTSQSIDPITEKEHHSEEGQEKRDSLEKSVSESQAEAAEIVLNQEDLFDAPCLSEEVMTVVKNPGSISLPSGESVFETDEKKSKITEHDEQRTKVVDKNDEKKDKLIEKSEERKITLTDKCEEQKSKETDKSEEQRNKLAKVPDRSEEHKSKEHDTSEVQKGKLSDKSEEQKAKKPDKSDKKTDILEKGDKKEEKRDHKMDKKEEKRENKVEKKIDHSKKADDGVKAKEEKPWKERDADSGKQTVYDKPSSKHRVTEVLKEEYSLEDSDLDSLSDITVSSVHTSDLSSFEEESAGEAAVSDSTEEGEITSDDEDEKMVIQNKATPQTEEHVEGKSKPVRHSYVHKPYLYSRYYSDSDDEQTVEQRRQSIARAKEERLLRRQMNRERLEEKRKLKASEKSKGLKKNTGKKGGEGSSSKGSVKEVLKEQKFLEKKVALSIKRQKDSRFSDSSWKRRYDYSEEDSRDSYKTSETFQSSTSKNLKHVKSESSLQKSSRKSSEPVHLTEEKKDDTKTEREPKRRTSSLLEVTSQDSETREIKKRADRLDGSYEEHPKKKSVSKAEKHKKESTHTETHNSRSTLKKGFKPSREKCERDRSLSDDKSSSRHRHKTDSVQKAEDQDRRSAERGMKGEEKQTKSSSDDKSDRKGKHKSERKLLAYSKDGRTVSEYTIRTDESVRREHSRKERSLSTEKSRSEHKSRRSTSDSKTHKDSQGSVRQSTSVFQKKTDTYSEDKYDLDSTNSDSNSKHEESIHKERRRTRSSSEEKSSLKSKSKSSSKPSKFNEAESQDAPQKPDKEMSLVDGNSDKHCEDSIISKLQRIAYSGISPEKETCHKMKFQSEDKVNERKSDSKELSLSKPDKKVSTEFNKGRSSKQCVREIKRKEDGSKAEDKQGKQVEESHQKMHGASVALDKKANKKISESRREVLLADKIQREAQLIAVTSIDGPVSTYSKQSGNSSCSELESELMEIDSQQTENISESNGKSPMETASKKSLNVNTLGGQPRHPSELKPVTASVAIECQVKFNSDSKIHFDEDSYATDANSESLHAVKHSEEQDAIKHETCQMNNACITHNDNADFIANSLAVQECPVSHKIEKTSNSIKKRTSTVISSSTSDYVAKSSKDVESSNPVVCELAEENEKITSLMETRVVSGSNLSVTADHVAKTSRVSSQSVEESKSSVKKISQKPCNKEHMKGMHEAEITEKALTVHHSSKYVETVKLTKVEKGVSFVKTVATEKIPRTNIGGGEHLTMTAIKGKLGPLAANQDTVTKPINLPEITEQKDGLITDTNTEHEVVDTVHLRAAGTHLMSDHVGTSAQCETFATVHCSDLLKKNTATGTVAQGSAIHGTEDKTETTALGNNTEDGEKDIYSRTKEAIGITLGSNTEEMEQLRTEDIEGRGLVIDASPENKVESTVMDLNAESETGAMRHSVKDEEATSSCTVMDSRTGRNNAVALTISTEKDSENAASSSGTVTHINTEEHIFSTRMSTEKDPENAATSSTTVADRSTHKTESVEHLEKESEAATSSSNNVMCTSNSNKQEAEREVDMMSSEYDCDDSASSTGSLVGTSTWEGKVINQCLGIEGDEAASSSGSMVDRNTEERAPSSSETVIQRGTEERAESSSETMLEIITEERAASSTETIMDRNAEERTASSSGTMMDGNTEKRTASSSETIMDRGIGERAESSSETMANRNTDDRAASSSETMTDKNKEERTASSSETMVNRNAEDRAASSSETPVERDSQKRTASSSGTMMDGNSEEQAASSSKTIVDRNMGETAASSSETMLDRNPEDRAASSSEVTVHRNTGTRAASSSETIVHRNEGERAASSSETIVHRNMVEGTASSSRTMMDRNAEERTASSSETTADKTTDETTASSSGSMMDAGTEDRTASSSGTIMGCNTDEGTASSSGTVLDRNSDERAASSSGTTIYRSTEETPASSSGTAVNGNTEDRTASSSVTTMDRSTEGRAGGSVTFIQKNRDNATSSSSTSGHNVGPRIHTAKNIHRVILYAEGNESSIGQDDVVNSGCAVSGEGVSVSSATHAKESDTTLPSTGSATSENDETMSSTINNEERKSSPDTVQTESIVNCEKTEEKEDTVSSASSEEKHKGFSLGSRQDFESTETELCETEGDRTVTSVGNMVGDASIVCENSGESESSVSCANLEKGDRADCVTCANGVYPVGEAAVFEDVKEEGEGVITGANVQENLIEGDFTHTGIVNEAYDAMTSSVINHQGQTAAVNTGVEEGESAVTSTGITVEGQIGAVAVFTETENRGDFLSSGVEEKDDDDTLNRMDAKEGAFSEDDESAITSTGTKEDEEGEGFVTSTGTANEDSSPGTVSEENVERVVIPTIPGGEGIKFCTDPKENGVVTVTSAGDVQPVHTMTSVSAVMELSMGCASGNDTIENTVKSGGDEADNKSTLLNSTSENKHDMIAKDTENVCESVMTIISMADGESKIAVLDKKEHAESCSTAAVPEIVDRIQLPLTLNPQRCEDAMCFSNTEAAKCECAKKKVERALELETSAEKTEDLQSHLHVKEIDDIPTDQNGTVRDATLTEASNDSETVEEDVLQSLPRKATSSTGSSPKTCLHSVEPSVQITAGGILSIDNISVAANLMTELKKEQYSGSSVSPVDKEGCSDTNRIIDGYKQDLGMESCEHERSKSGEPVKVVDTENTSETYIKETVQVEKRKRGRPKKHPSSTQEICLSDEYKGISEKKSSTEDDASDTSKECASLTGRKHKRSFSSTEESEETLEPPKKRQISDSTAKENEEEDDDDEDEDNAEDEDDDDEEENRGATTRAASRLEAQSKQPHKPTTRAASKLGIPEPISPRDRRATKEKLISDVKPGKSTQLRSTPQPSTSTKRRRESSPQPVRSCGQQTPEESQMKRRRQ